MMCTTTSLLVPQLQHAVWNDTLERVYVDAAWFSVNKYRQCRGKPSLLLTLNGTLPTAADKYCKFCLYSYISQHFQCLGLPLTQSILSSMKTVLDESETTECLLSRMIRCCMDTNFKEPSTPRSHVSYYKFIVEYWFHYCLLSVHSSPPSSSLGTSVSVWTKLALRWLCGPSWLRLSSCLMIFETWPTVRGPYCRTKWLLPSTRTPWVSREDACCRFSSHISDIVLFTVNKQGLTYTTVH